MRRWLGSCMAVAGLALAAGCLQRVDTPLPPMRRGSAIVVPQWDYAGSFGGRADLTAASDDPWERRYRDGTFLRLAGINATDNEVWACDTGISRLQVFDHEGRLLRVIGDGVEIDGTLPSDIEHFTEEQTLDLQTGQKWEATPAGQRWVSDKENLFKAADVFVLPTGFWLADQAMSSGYGEKARPAAIRFYGLDGRRQELPTDGLIWPLYLAVSGNEIAFTEEWGNILWMATLDAEGWKVDRPGNIQADFRNIARVRRDFSQELHYGFRLRVAGNASSEEGKFDVPGGLAYYGGKLIACDQRNRRLQVFEARPIDQTYWKQLLKIIPARRQRDGAVRFASPRDVDIAADGIVYLLDGELREVAMLSPTFERIGTIRGVHLEDPHALTLSPDGRSLFVSDPGASLIHRYVQH